MKEFALSLGDDVTANILKLYTAFKRIKNFATMEIYQSNIRLNLKLNPEEFKSQFSDTLRDIRNIGHWGCGDLQLIIKENDDITLAKDLIKKAYDEN